jgi:hypothetical protein
MLSPAVILIHQKYSSKEKQEYADADSEEPVQCQWRLGSRYLVKADVVDSFRLIHIYRSLDFHENPLLKAAARLSIYACNSFPRQTQLRTTTAASNLKAHHETALEHSGVIFNAFFSKKDVLLFSSVQDDLQSIDDISGPESVRLEA